MEDAARALLCTIYKDPRFISDSLTSLIDFAHRRYIQYSVLFHPTHTPPVVPRRSTHSFFIMSRFTVLAFLFALIVAVIAAPSATPAGLEQRSRTGRVCLYHTSVNLSCVLTRSLILSSRALGSTSASALAVSTTRTATRSSPFRARSTAAASTATRLVLSILSLGITSSMLPRAEGEDQEHCQRQDRDGHRP